MIRFVDFIRRLTMICSFGLTVMAVHPPVVVASSNGAVETTVRAGYTLQVAAFSSRAQADELAAGIVGTWIQEVRQEGRPIFRVNFGRFNERAEAVRAQWSLDDQGYKSFIQQLFS